MCHPLVKSTLTALAFAGLSPAVAQADNTFSMYELERAATGDISPYTEPAPAAPAGPAGRPADSPEEAGKQANQSSPSSESQDKNN